MNRRRPKPGVLQRQCDQFNGTYAVGTAVVVHLDSGEAIEMIILSRAEVLSGHSAVIWLDGVSGAFSLDRIVPKLRS